jgi:hypothetical protein
VNNPLAPVLDELVALRALEDRLARLERRFARLERHLDSSHGAEDGLTTATSKEPSE